MHPILFQWGFLRLYSYGFFVALGILAATLLLVKKVEKRGKSPQFIVDLVILVAVAGIIGARLVYVFLYEPVYYLSHPLEILMLNRGGLAFYGAFLFGMTACYLYLRRIGVPFLAFLDLAAPAAALGYSIARIGCFLNGCCYGVPTDLPWGVTFPVVDDLPRHPTQLYSFISGIVIFAVLEWSSRRVRFRGQVFSQFLILYGLTRGLIELFRANPFVWGGWVASATALSLALAGGLLYLYLSRQRTSAYLDGLERGE